jgi:Cu/Ag efflux pump CusA
MLWSVVGSSVRFRVLGALIAAGILIVGGLQLRRASVDVLPEFSPPTVQIQTESLGLSAPEVEQLITVPMEQDLLNGVLGVERIESDSTPGVSTIRMIFGRGTNVLDDRELVQERISQAVALPNVSRPPVMLDPVSSTGRVLSVALSSNRLTPIQLGVLARWTIRPRLVGLPGVSNVAIWGLRDRQLQTLVDPARLAAEGVTLEDVVRTAGNAQMVSPLSFLDASTPGTGGFVDGPNQRLSVLHQLPFGTPADLAHVPLEGGPPGNHLRLGDVATIVEGNQPLIGDAVVGRAAGMLLVVEKLPGANTLQVTHEIEHALDELRPGLSGVQVSTSSFRPADYVENALSNVGLALIIGGVLLLVVFAGFFLSWQAVIASTVAVAVSVLVALLVLLAMGDTINALVIVGLLAAAGVIADDAAGATEAIIRRVRRVREADPRAPVGPALVERLVALRSSLGYAALIGVLVAVPILLITGLDGAFVHPIALSFLLAVVASAIVATTVTPALCALLLWHTRLSDRESALARVLARRYRAGLRRVLGPASSVAVGLCLAGLAGLAVLPFLSPPSQPTFKNRDVLVRWRGPPGTSLIEMDRVTARAAGQIRALQGIRAVTADVGRAATGDRPVNTDASQVWVSIDPKADLDRTLGELRAYVRGVPGLDGQVVTYESDRMAGILQPVPDQVTLRVYGEDYDILDRKALELAAVMSRIRGIGRPRINLPLQEPELAVGVSLAAAQRNGVLPAEVRRQVATLVSGVVVGSLFEDQKVFDVVVVGVPATRLSVDSVRSLLIDTPGGGKVPLAELAQVSVRPEPADIQHEDVSRYLDVTFPVRGRDVGAVQDDVARNIREVRFPLEYNAVVIRNAPDSGTPHSLFVLYLLAAALGALLLMQAAFDSWRLAAVFFASVPLALVGGVVVAYAAGWQSSIGAQTGLAAVLAFAVRQVIVTVRHLQRLEWGDEVIARDGEASRRALVLRGAEERLPPTLLGAIAAAAAVAPFLLLGDVAGNELTQPLAGVVLGGIVSSTLITLFLVPAAYLRLIGKASQQEPCEAERLIVRLGAADVHRRHREKR